MNPEDQAEMEEMEEAAESEEEIVEEVSEDPPMDATPMMPAQPVQSLDDRIADGAADVQAKVEALRNSKTAEHDARIALATAQAESQRLLSEAQAMIDEADGAEADALAAANAAIDAQIVNLTSLKATLNP